jgi:ankyrin repeat protein
VQCWPYSNTDDPPFAAAAEQAAVNGHAEVVKQLLAAGADPQQQNKDGKTPADLAKTDAVKALIVGQ